MCSAVSVSSGGSKVWKCGWSIREGCCWVKFQYPLGDRRFGNTSPRKTKYIGSCFSILWGIEGLEISDIVRDVRNYKLFQYPLGDRRFGNMPTHRCQPRHSIRFSILWGIEGLEIVCFCRSWLCLNQFQYPLGDRRFGNFNLGSTKFDFRTFQYPLGDRRFGNNNAYGSNPMWYKFQYPLGDRRFGNLLFLSV